MSRLSRTPTKNSYKTIKSPKIELYFLTGFHSLLTQTKTDFNLTEKLDLNATNLVGNIMIQLSGITKENTIKKTADQLMTNYELPYQVFIFSLGLQVTKTNIL